MIRLVDSDGTPSVEFLQPFRVEHDLVAHPLMARDAIVELARRLPRGSIEVSGDDAAVVAGIDYRGQVLDGDPGEAVRALDGRHHSLYFYNIESDPVYGPLVVDLVGEGLDILDVAPEGVVSREGYLFLAGDTAITSAHVDHECNFLLVTEGRKRVWLAEIGDPAGEIALEALHSGRYGSCATRPESLRPYDLGPGDGIFIPPRSAHYVENGPGRCTALSVVFLHRSTQREVPVYAWNARLRRIGLRPTPPGRSAWRDSLKRRSFESARSLRQLVR